MAVRTLVDRKPLPARKQPPYTLGEINKVIDAFMHPIAREDPWYWLADGLLHGLFEQDPKVTIDKFLRYNVPKILEQALRDQNRKTKRKCPRSYY